MTENTKHIIAELRQKNYLDKWRNILNMKKCIMI